VSEGKPVLPSLWQMKENLSVSPNRKRLIAKTAFHGAVVPFF
jgi:hypothetical protein